MFIFTKESLSVCRVSTKKHKNAMDDDDDDKKKIRIKKKEKNQEKRC